MYVYTKKVEAATDAAYMPFTDTFRTCSRFIVAVRRFKRALIAPLDWKRVTMTIGGHRYTVCFRDALQAAQEQVLQASSDDLCWEPPPATSPILDSSAGAAAQPLLRGAWDGEMYQKHAAHVRATMDNGTQVLVLHLYSDSTVLSGSGAVSAYTLLMRIVNINAKVEQWVTIAYIPQVVGKFMDTSGGHEVRSELLQRVLHLTLRTAIQASHSGAWMDLPDGGKKRVSPRALLYVCDQPEERAVMCLKASGCLYPCTPCKVERENSCSAAGATAPMRDVEETVGAQLSNATMETYWGSKKKRTEVELEHSLNSVVPAMAASAGLGNAPRLLYSLPGFDRLLVRFRVLLGLFYHPCRAALFV